MKNISKMPTAQLHQMREAKAENARSYRKAIETGKPALEVSRGFEKAAIVLENEIEDIDAELTSRSL